MEYHACYDNDVQRLAVREVPAIVAESREAELSGGQQIGEKMRTWVDTDPDRARDKAGFYDEDDAGSKGDDRMDDK